jgi:hypothetical protein
MSEAGAALYIDCHATAETALAGWGARIRTWEWRNQNPPVPPLISTIILKNPRISTRFQAIG